MGQGTDNFERTTRTKPQRSEFENANTAIVHRIAHEAVKANRRADRREAARARAAMVDDHAASLID